MGQFVIQLNARTPGGSTVQIYFALGAGIAFADFQYVPSGLLSWASTTQKVDIDASGTTSSTDDQGKIIISNVADTFGGAGPLDAYLRTYGFQHQAANLYYCPDQTWANKVLVDVGAMEQPIVSGAISDQLSDTVQFPLRDFRGSLDTPFSTATYSGGGALEGSGLTIVHKRKPIIYGRVQNISPVMVNSSLLIYQLSKGDGFVLDARDGGVSLTNGGDFTGNMAGFQAASVTSGTYVTFRDNLSGTGSFVRLGSTPVYGLTLDVQEMAGGSTVASQLIGDIWSRISTAIGRTVDSASVSAVNALCTANSGLYLDADDTSSQKDVLDLWLSGTFCFEVYDPIAATWKIRRLSPPTSGGSMALRALRPTSRLTASDRKLISASLARPPWCQNGAPPIHVTVNCGRNYTPQSRTNLATSVTAFLVDYYGAAWEEVQPDILSISGPWDVQSQFVSDTVLTAGSGLAEADSRKSVFANYFGYFQVSFIPAVYPSADRLLAGDAITMALDRYGDPSKQKFMVFQSSLTVDQNGPVMSAIIGLETA